MLIFKSPFLFYTPDHYMKSEWPFELSDYFRKNHTGKMRELCVLSSYTSMLNFFQLIVIFCKVNTLPVKRKVNNIFSCSFSTVFMVKLIDDL